jgi:molybdopterin converting factor small subunit
MSSVVIRIPTPLRGYTRGADEVRVEGASVGEALKRLGSLHAGVFERVIDERGDLRPFVNVFVGSSDVRALDGLETRLEEGAVLSIVPAVAGGTT